MVEVPVIREVVPRRGLVAIASGSAGFFVFVGFGLIFQDLGNDPAVGFGGDEDLWEDQRACGSSALLALVLLDSSRLGSGRRGTWWWWRWVGAPVVALDGGWWVRWQGIGAGDGRGDEGLVVVRSG